MSLKSTIAPVVAWIAGLSLTLKAVGGALSLTVILAGYGGCQRACQHRRDVQADKAQAARDAGIVALKREALILRAEADTRERKLAERDAVIAAQDVIIERAGAKAKAARADVEKAKATYEAKLAAVPDYGALTPREQSDRLREEFRKAGIPVQ